MKEWMKKYSWKLSFFPTESPKKAALEWGCDDNMPATCFLGHLIWPVALDVITALQGMDDQI